MSGLHSAGARPKSLRAALIVVAEAFAGYATYQLAKTPPVTDRAERNREMEQRCLRATRPGTTPARKRAMLQEAATVFTEYAKSHADRQQTAKAVRNLDLVEICLATIAAADKAQKPAKSAAVYRMLDAMRSAEDDGNFEDGEAVYDRGQVWVGLQTFAPATVTKALRMLALKDQTDSGSPVHRYAINDVGRAYLANPGMLDDINAAIQAGGAWTVKNGAIVRLEI